MKNVENPCVLATQQRATAVNSSACFNSHFSAKLHKKCNQSTQKYEQFVEKFSDFVLVFCAAQGFACDIFGYVCARTATSARVRVRVRRGTQK